MVGVITSGGNVIDSNVVEISVLVAMSNDGVWDIMGAVRTIMEGTTGYRVLC